MTKSINPIYNSLMGGSTPTPTNPEEVADTLYKSTGANNLDITLKAINLLSNMSEINQSVLARIIICILSGKINDTSYDCSPLIKDVFAAGGYTWEPAASLTTSSKSLNTVFNHIYSVVNPSGGGGALHISMVNLYASVITKISSSSDPTPEIQRIFTQLKIIRDNTTPTNHLKQYYDIASTYFNTTYSGGQAGGNKLSTSDIVRLFSPPLMLGLSQPTYVQYTDANGNLKPPQLNYDWVPQGAAYPGLPVPTATLPNGEPYPNIEIYLGLLMGGPIGSFGNWRGKPFYNHRGGMMSFGLPFGIPVARVHPVASTSNISDKLRGKLYRTRPGGDDKRDKVNTKVSSSSYKNHAHLIIRCIMLDHHERNTLPTDSSSCPSESKISRPTFDDDVIEEYKSEGTDSDDLEKMLLFLLRLFRRQCGYDTFEQVPLTTTRALPFPTPFMLNPYRFGGIQIPRLSMPQMSMPNMFRGPIGPWPGLRGGGTVENKHKFCMGRLGGRNGATLDPVYDELPIICGKPFLGGSKNDGKFPNLNYSRLGKSVKSILPMFLNRIELYNTYNGILKNIGEPMQGGGRIKGKPYPMNFPKIVGYPINKYDEFITNINGNKHIIYKVKKAIDFYMGLAKRHNINIPFESEIYSLLKSINTTYNTYTKNTLDLQKTTVVIPKEGTLDINPNDLKYEANYSAKIKHHVSKLNNCKNLFTMQLHTLFSLEEQLFNIVKHDLVKHYAIR